MTGIYEDGTYGLRNPDWHTADSAWKADRIAEILLSNGVSFQSCVEVGCGAGLILDTLAKRWPGGRYEGYDISPDAAGFWARRHSPARFHEEDFSATETHHDLLLIDVFEHVEDYIGFLRMLASRADWFVFHIPLEMTVSGLLRDRQIHSRDAVGHLHYFSRATALATLRDAGFDVVMDCFTKLSQQTVEGYRPATALGNVARRLTQLASTNLASKLFGGYSLLVLCRPRNATKAKG
jgi:SAM-dependent methyltransferase